MLNELWSTLLANLQALYTAHQSAHWRSKGDNFYGDHLMYQRMYEGIQSEIDSVAERLIATTNDETLLDPSRMLAASTAALKTIVVAGDIASSMLIAEKTFLKHLCNIIEAMDHVGALSVGVENLLQGIADKHEEHIYLLTRRSNIEVIAVCVKEALNDVPTILTDVSILKAKINESKKKSKKRKKKQKKNDAWYIGGPISTGPGNSGFGSSSGV